ncbi:hypothetical protein VIGAN_03089500 [Vigna angularis var. angularis]|uniref:DUF547 domain-containing protein n=1 Tax=Vigna angularis var. angularis TaxID=157739 RepID=A0A0S3RKT9_PHAAN|nr:hypothetical protein VIGAN_03089500 [Vigna angularis var. angularis]
MPTSIQEIEVDFEVFKHCPHVIVLFYLLCPFLLIIYVLFCRVLMHKLCDVDLSFLTYKQKLAFWINIYNACIMNVLHF